MLTLLGLALALVVLAGAGLTAAIGRGAEYMSACRRKSSSSLDVMLSNAGMVRRRSSGGRATGITSYEDISGPEDIASSEAMESV